MPDDGLPNVICNQCKEHLTFTAEFKDRCLKVNDTLRQIIREQSISEEKIEEDPLQIFSCNERSCDYKSMSYYDYCQHCIIHDRKKTLTELYCALQTHRLLLISKKYINYSKVKNLVNERKYGNVTTASEVLQKPSKSSDLNEKSTKCSLCSRQFTNYFQLLLHFLQHAALEQNLNNDTESYFFCEFCGEVYQKKEELKEHSNRLHGAEVESQWQCRRCDEVFEDDTDVLRHERIANHFESFIPENGVFECLLCSQQYTNVSNLLTHSICHLIKQYNCKDCKKQFISEGSLKSHLKSHADFIVTCTICKEFFVNKEIFQKHLKSHGIQSDDGNDRHDSSINAEDFSSHVTDNVQENQSDIYNCETCETTFSDFWSLKKHLYLHKRHKAFKCTVCDESFKWKYCLDYHMISKHKQVKNYPVKGRFKCMYTDCSRSFITSNHLNCHIRVHLGIKMHKCKICERKFLDSSALKSHLLVHTGEKAFSCNLCDQKFRLKHHLKLHVVSKHKSDLKGAKIKQEKNAITEEPYKCSYDNCDESFNSLIGLTGHIRRHNRPAAYECENCHKKFKDGTCFKKHLILHTNERPFSCNLCDQKFRQKKYLKRHVISRHESEPQSNTVKLKPKTHKCGICEKAFTTSTRLKEHSLAHTGEKPFPCPVCDRRFRRKDNLEQHIICKHTSVAKSDKLNLKFEIYKCNICEKEVAHVSNFKKHLLVHTGGRPFSCTACDKTFKRKIHMEEHILSAHESGAKTTELNEKLKPYKCDICKKAFTNSTHLKRHMVAHTSERPFSCDLCSQKFKRKHHLKQHFINKHVKLREHEDVDETENIKNSYNCSFPNCDESFNCKSSLANHVLHHEQPKTYECKYCKKIMSDSTSLNRHLRRHTGGKPFSCEVCAERFITKHHLQEHVKSKHESLAEEPKESKLKVWTHSCDTCGRKFFDSANFKTHLLRHTGEKSFACDICNEEFRLKHNLKRHINSKHAELSQSNKLDIQTIKLEDLDIDEKQITEDFSG